MSKQDLVWPLSSLPAFVTYIAAILIALPLHLAMGLKEGFKDWRHEFKVLREELNE